jgi:excisionase family DNA binding protein
MGKSIAAPALAAAPVSTPRASTTERRRRLFDKTQAAEYMTVSTDTIERLIYAGALPVVKLPVERGRNNRGESGTSRRVLLDVNDLDRLIEQSKERVR